MQFLRQPLLGELAMSRKRERREKNAIYSGHLRLCQQPRAAHALRYDQKLVSARLELSFTKFCNAGSNLCFFSYLSFCSPYIEVHFYFIYHTFSSILFLHMTYEQCTARQAPQKLRRDNM